MKPYYIGALHLGYLDGDKWLLLEPFAFCRSDGEQIHVPAGYETDLASVPHIFRWILPQAGDGPHARYGRAAVIHDWMCQHPLQWARTVADDTLRQAMRVDGVSTWRISVIYHACALYTWCSGK